MTDWTYYIVENCFIVRLDLKTSHAKKLLRNGEWENYPDLRDITYNGRLLKDKGEALAAAKELFALYPELE